MVVLGTSLIGLGRYTLALDDKVKLGDVTWDHRERVVRISPAAEAQVIADVLEQVRDFECLRLARLPLARAG